MCMINNFYTRIWGCRYLVFHSLLQFLVPHVLLQVVELFNCPELIHEHNRCHYLLRESRWTQWCLDSRQKILILSVLHVVKGAHALIEAHRSTYSISTSTCSPLHGSHKSGCFDFFEQWSIVYSLHPYKESHSDAAATGSPANSLPFGLQPPPGDTRELPSN